MPSAAPQPPTSLRIAWSPNFSVGHELLDKQHQILVVQINRLADWIDTSTSRSTYHDILNELMMYSEVHFTAEEAVLERCGYADLRAQQDEHAAYNAYLTDVMIAALDGFGEKMRLQEFLTGWWSNHILISDMKYKNMFDEREFSQPTN